MRRRCCCRHPEPRSSRCFACRSIEEGTGYSVHEACTFLGLRAGSTHLLGWIAQSPWHQSSKAGVGPACKIGTSNVCLAGSQGKCHMSPVNTTTSYASSRHAVVTNTTAHHHQAVHTVHKASSLITTSPPPPKPSARIVCSREQPTPLAHPKRNLPPSTLYSYHHPLSIVIPASWMWSGSSSSSRYQEHSAGG